MARTEGTIVAWKGGYGFASTTEGDEDVFVLLTEVPAADQGRVQCGTKLTFDVINAPRGLRASRIEVLS